MAREYQLCPARRAVNAVVSALLRVGIPAPQRTSYLMTTTGRKTKLDRTTPVNLVDDGTDRWLVSPYGDVPWVLNVRANSALVLRRGRYRESVIADEVGPDEAA